MYHIHQNYIFQFSWEHNLHRIVSLFHQIYEQPFGIFLTHAVSSHLAKKNLRAFASNLLTLTWWYMNSISAAITILWFLNLVKTPTRFFSKSGPVNNAVLRFIQSYSPAASKTILILFGLFSLKTGGWRRYHFLLLTSLTSFFDGYLAYPFFR